MLIRWVKRIVTAIALTFLAILIYSFLTIGAGPVEGWLIKLPRTRDRRLVGAWTGRFRMTGGPDTLTMVTEFHADGTAISTWIGKHYWMPFNWGSEDGILYTRRVAVDAWSTTNQPYDFSDGEKTVRFGPLRRFRLVCQEMKRIPSPHSVR